MHEEFQKAFNDYPSQDNEGHVPDRGGFKAGFFAAWHLLEPIIDAQARLLGCYRTGARPPESVLKVLEQWNEAARKAGG